MHGKHLQDHRFHLEKKYIIPKGNVGRGEGSPSLNKTLLPYQDCKPTGDNPRGYYSVSIEVLHGTVLTSIFCSKVQILQKQDTSFVGAVGIKIQSVTNHTLVLLHTG